MTNERSIREVILFPLMRPEKAQGGDEIAREGKEEQDGRADG
jgi:hypothetical protein